MRSQPSKDILKDTNEQPSQEIYRARYGRVLRTGTSVLMDLSMSPSPYGNMFPQSGSCAFRIFIQASSLSHDQSLTQFLAPLPFLEDVSGEAEISQLLIMVWSSWEPAPTQEPSRMHAESPH